MNDAPTATNLSAAETYTEDTALNLINIVVSDVDSANVTATLTLSNVAAGSLSTGTSGAVTSTFVGGVWTASGAIANVNTLLAGVTFTPALNFNSNFTIATSVSDGVAPAITGVKNMTGTPVNDAPVVDLNAGAAGNNVTTAFTEQTPVLIAPVGTLTDVDSANLTSLTVTLTARPDGNAVESLSLNAAATTAASGAGLTVSYTAGTGVLSITGAATTAVYESILQGIQYNDTSNTPTTSNRTINVVANDGVTASVTRTVTLTVAAVNDAPTATNLSAAETYTEDTALNLINIVVSDVDSANVTATLTLSNVAAGSLSTGTSGAVTSTFVGGVWTASGAIANVNTLLAGVTFTPALNFNSNFTIATSVSDGVAPAITGVKNMTGTAVDDSFTDADETVSVLEDSGANLGNVLTGTSSVDGPVTVTQFQVAGDVTVYAAGSTATIAGVGTLQIAANGAYTFTPAANYNGPVPVVTYTVTDGSGTDDTSTLTLTVTPVDDSFTDADETVSVLEDSGANLGNVLTGTSSVDGPVTVTQFQVAGDVTVYAAGSTATIAGVGTLQIAANGAYTFTPAANYNGPVPVVTYTVTDGSGTDDTSTLTLTVTPVDDSFTDADETVSVLEDSGANLGNVLTGTSSVDGPVTVTQFQVAGDVTVYAAGSTATIAGVGTLQIAANGAYTFTPAANYNGPVPVVTYTVTDGSGTDDTSTLTLTVTPVDDSFTDADETVSVLEDSGANLGNVLTGTSSVDGPVTVTQFQVAGDVTVYAAGSTATIAGVGTLQIAANGAYTFTPAANYNGPVPVVTYTVTDGSGTDDTSTLTLTVTPVDDSFTDADETVSVLEDSGANLGNVLTGTSSVDGAVTVTQLHGGGRCDGVRGGFDGDDRGGGHAADCGERGLHVHAGGELQRPGAGGDLHGDRRVRDGRHLDADDHGDPGG